MSADANQRDLAAARQRFERVIAQLGEPDTAALVRALAGQNRQYDPDVVRREWESAFEGGPDPEAATNLYIHVPYCKSLCTFCNYKRLRIPDRDSLERYVTFLVGEARRFAPAFRSVRLGSLFMGGGTPSVLSATQLDRLLGAVHEGYAFHDGAEKTFEYDPMVMTDDRFGILERYGFTRYTFGIQSLESRVNELNGRGKQTRDHVGAQFAHLQRLTGSTSNVDFLLGLAGTTPEGMIAEIEEILCGGRPDAIQIYFMTATDAYVERHFGGDAARFEAFLRPFRDRVPGAVDRLAAAHGYSTAVAGSHALVLLRDRGGARAETPRHAYRDLPSNAHRPLSVLGLGDSARSRIFGRLQYETEFDDDGGRTSVRYVGVRSSRALEMFHYVAFTFRDGDVLDRARFHRTFGVDAAAQFAAPIARLASVGAAEVRGDAVVLAPQPPRDRLRDVMFFAPEDSVAAMDEERAGTAARGDAPTSTLLAPDQVRRLLAPLADGADVGGGWRVASVEPGGVVLGRGAERLKVRFVEPAGAHPAFVRTARFDVQYSFGDSPLPLAEFESAVRALAAVARRREFASE